MKGMAMDNEIALRGRGPEKTWVSVTSCGGIMVDGGDRERFFIQKDDVPKLYEWLRERIAVTDETKP